MSSVLHLGLQGPQAWQKVKSGWQPLGAGAPGPVFVITDLAEEGLAEIKIPRIFGKDRADLMERQLAGKFPETAFRTALAVPGHAPLMQRLAPTQQTLFGVDASDKIMAALETLDAPVAGVWGSTSLLAMLAGHKGLPATLFVVLPTADALRIVFVKAGTPALTRLVPGASDANRISSEIIRTLRHLENSRVIERGAARVPVLVLGPTQGLGALLAKDQLSLLTLPAPWADAPPPDWRFALFDQVLRAPGGQLAPLAVRSHFVAAKLRRAAAWGTAACLTLGVLASAAPIQQTIGAYQQKQVLQASLQELGVKTSREQASLAQFGVSPELLRQAVALDMDEVSSAPAMALQWQQLARALGGAGEVRVARLDWRLLRPGEPACGADASAKAAPEGAAAPEEQKPQRMAQLSLELTAPAELGPVQLARTLTGVSRALAAMPGARLLGDANAGEAQAELRGGSRPSVDKSPAWCLTLPGSTAPPKGATKP